MKSTGLMFKAPLVRSILSGQKTQTRRICKPVRGYERNNICRPDKAHESWAVWWHGAEIDRVGCLQECPFGKPGDQIWVRETWQGWRRTSHEYEEYETMSHEERGGRTINQYAEYYGINSLSIRYQADGVACPDSWIPAIHMPRWASRIALEITDVRVEQLERISEQDAIAEGFDSREDFSMFFAPEVWNANPWCWVIGFRKVTA